MLRSSHRSDHRQWLPLTAASISKTLRVGVAGAVIALSPATAQISRAQDVPEVAARKLSWSRSMLQQPSQRPGCYRSDYPSTTWKQVRCTSGPSYPMPPRRGARALTVGNGSDVSAQIASGFVSQAIGTFDSVSNVTSESSPIGNSGSPVANAYTLQLNTDHFTSSACAGSPNPGCLGWEQFVFENFGSGARAFIQYWLLRFNTTCPSGWNQFSFNGSSDIYCFRNNSSGAVSIPVQPIGNLANLSVTATVTASSDSVAVSTGSSVFTVNGDNSVNAAASWKIAEFNVFGDGGNSSGGGGATFNSGAVIVPRTRVFGNTNAAPMCVAQGFTGETNNLSFGPSAPLASPPGPALIFSESSAGGAAFCGAATSVGDTHLATLGGLLYDFQASGDFVLADIEESEFQVQTRQVSGAPTWPNAAVNQAVAARMGKTEVALCLARDTHQPSLFVDGQSTALQGGATLSLPEGVDIIRTGDTYVIIAPGGDSVRATVHPTWLDVSVGMGHWPANVRGLIASPKEDANLLEARDGSVLQMPFAFDELYKRFGDSWRVSPSESLLAVCGKDTEQRNPSRPLLSKDLDPQLRERAQAVCTNAGIKDELLLQACILDVAVIGDKAAAEIFVNAQRPKQTWP